MASNGLILVSPEPRHRRCSRDAKALLTIATRRLWSQSPCACRRPIRYSAKRAANIAHVSPHPSPAWQSVRTRQRGSQIDPIYIQGRSWRVPQQHRPQLGAGRSGAVRTPRGRLARSATDDHIKAHRRCSILLTVINSRLRMFKRNGPGSGLNSSWGRRVFGKTIQIPLITYADCFISALGPL